jgi:hypothetical protein
MAIADYLKNSNDIVLGVLGVIAGAILIVRMTNWSLILFIALTGIGYSIMRNWFRSLCVSAIGTYLLVMLNPPIGVPLRKQGCPSWIETYSPSGLVSLEGFQVPKEETKKTKKSSKKVMKEEEEDIEAFDDNEEDYLFDSKESFASNLKSMTPAQVKGLNNDTKELIKTQKMLLETLQNMGPALKEGKTVLDTFKTYFGSTDMKDGMDLEKLQDFLKM